MGMLICASRAHVKQHKYRHFVLKKNTFKLKELNAHLNMVQQFFLTIIVFFNHSMGYSRVLQNDQNTLPWLK
jgi:hypothetical protein